MIAGLACNPVRQTTKRLHGDWQIISFEEQTGMKPGVLTTNIGQIVLNPDKTGKRIFAYSILGLSANDTTHFNWNNTENTILIDNQQEDGSKIWIITNQTKKAQTWKTTDGKSTMQTMKFERIKEK
jgi:hypothetical protein